MEAVGEIVGSSLGGSLGGSVWKGDVRLLSIVTMTLLIAGCNHSRTAACMTWHGNWNIVINIFVSASD